MGNSSPIAPIFSLVVVGIDNHGLSQRLGPLALSGLVRWQGAGPALDAGI